MYRCKLFGFEITWCIQCNFSFKSKTNIESIGVCQIQKYISTSGNILPDLPPHCIDDADLSRRVKHLRKCKDTVWKRWSREYLCGLRENITSSIKTNSEGRTGEVASWHCPGALSKRRSSESCQIMFRQELPGKTSAACLSFGTFTWLSCLCTSPRT